jgi:hypothetical protein
MLCVWCIGKNYREATNERKIPKQFPVVAVNAKIDGG